jgi:hypothetical protein
MKSGNRSAAHDVESFERAWTWVRRKPLGAKCGRTNSSVEQLFDG